MSASTLQAAIDRAYEQFLLSLQDAVTAAWSPPPELSLSDWADEYRVLSKESTAEYGQWSTNRVPYLREIMNACTDDDTEEVTCMKSAQVAWTEGIVLNLTGYCVHQDPCPMMVIMPTLLIGAAWSKDRLDPMVRDSEVLSGKLTGNSALHKQFPGGHITVAGANSAASLSSRPIRVLLCDEVDRFPYSAGEEGDPLTLGEKRTTTFFNRKKIRGGTPTIKGMSRTEMLFDLGTKERYHVPCPHCGHEQTLKWSQVKWDKDGKEHLPETTRYECESCNEAIYDQHLQGMLEAGRWIAEQPEKGPFHRSFHINELYSPWVTFQETVEAFLKAKNDRQLLKVWTNTSLGETFEDKAEVLDTSSLYARREPYIRAPAGVLTIVAGVDMQDDRFELELLGANDREETWSLDYRVYYGNPAEDEIWNRLRAVLLEEFLHESGVKLMVDAMGIDTQGHFTKEAYAFCKPLWERRVYALNGVDGFGRPPVGRYSTSNKGKVRLFPVGVDVLKQTVYGRLKIQEPGPGYCHFPLVPHYDHEHFKRLTSERLVRTFERGQLKQKWIKTMARNEPLDCRVYALATLDIMDPEWSSFYHRISHGGVDFTPPDEKRGMDQVRQSPGHNDPFGHVAVAQAQQGQAQKGRRQISRGVS